MTNASDYADGIAAEVRTVEHLASIDLDALRDVARVLEDYDADPADGDELRDALEAADLDLDADDEIDWIRENGGTLEDYGDVFTAWLEESCLDVELEGKRSLRDTEWTVQRVVITRTTGGPGATVTFSHGSTDAVVEVAWGGDTSRRHVHAPELKALALELADL